MQTKNWYQSKTVWSGILKLLAGIITSFAGLLVGEVDVQTFLTGVVVAVIGIYDIRLRFKTYMPIK